MPGSMRAAEGFWAGTVPEVTVLVPAFNVEKYLPMTLAGLQAQDFGGWVCHILDDGSTDGIFAHARWDDSFRASHACYNPALKSVPGAQ